MEYDVGTLVRPVSDKKYWIELDDVPSISDDLNLSEDNLAVVLGVNPFKGYLIGFLDDRVDGHDGCASLMDEAGYDSPLYKRHAENETCWDVLPCEIVIAENQD